MDYILKTSYDLEVRSNISNFSSVYSSVVIF